MPDVEDAGIEAFYTLAGERVRSARIDAGISQELLARRVGLTRSSIANLEAGRQRVALHLFVSISDALNRDVCELLPKKKRSHFGLNLTRVQDKLANSPESMQNFVHGAVARRDAEHEDPEP